MTAAYRLLGDGDTIHRLVKLHPEDPDLGLFDRVGWKRLSHAKPVTQEEIKRLVRIAEAHLDYLRSFLDENQEQ